MATIKNRDWVEPAHPVLVERYADLVEIYRFFKEAIQPRVDEIFDRVSKQIGFVVTTTLPVRLQFGEGGKIEKVEFAAKNLQGTLFEKEFMAVFKEISGKKLGKVAAGSYKLFLIWHEALKLKLKTDWIEPAHFRKFPGFRYSRQCPKNWPTSLTRASVSPLTGSTPASPWTGKMKY